MLNIFIIFSTISLIRCDISFLALGDWGGGDNAPYFTSGQLKTANGMNIIAGMLNASFIVALGDNFYDNGIRDGYGENSPRFQETWSDVYTGDYLKKPWYIVAGNHDWSGNVTAQIAYTQHDDYWTFPSDYYFQSFVDDNGVTLDIVMIDTVDLAGNIGYEESDPRYFDPLPVIPTSASAADQLVFIQQSLASSNAMYLLVLGHYPVYSVCKHGPTQKLINDILPLLEQYNAHFIAGHDHCLEHLQETESAVNHFVVGTGKECCYNNPNMKRVPSGSIRYWLASDNAPSSVSGGFASFTASSDGLVVTLYDQDANALYIAPSIPPRSLLVN